MAAIVDTEVLGKLVAAALVAGIGVTAIFGLVVYASTRLVDLRREGHAVAAALLGALAVLALLVFVAAVVLGLLIMADK